MTATNAAPQPKVRITKDPDVRREELLDVALDLCRAHGFDGLRVEQVVQAAGVAKGTFYHYFSSKYAVLEALVQRFGDSLFDELTTASAHPGTASERLRAIMDAAQAYKLSHGDLPLASFLLRDENLAMRHRVYRAWRGRAREVLVPVISSGVADGSFAVANAEGATDIVLLLWFDAGDHLWERALGTASADEFAEVMVAGAISIAEAQERVLGVPAGTYAITLSPEVIDLTKQLFATLEGKQS